MIEAGAYGLQSLNPRGIARVSSAYADFGFFEELHRLNPLTTDRILFASEMHKRFFALVIIAFCLPLPISANDSGLSSVSEQWELRSKIAASKLNDLIIELESLKMPHRDNKQDEETVRRIVSQLALESAYAHHQKFDVY